MSSCNIFKNLSEHDLFVINSVLQKFKHSPELYTKFITDRYRNVADVLLKIINDKKSKEGDAFPLPLDLTEEIPTELDIQPTQFVQKELMTSDDVIEIHYNGDRNGINRMFRTFSDAMVESAIYDKKTKRPILPNAKSTDSTFKTALNANIFNFKRRMMDTICKFTKTTYNKNYTNPSTFASQIQEVLSAFYAKLTSPTLTDSERNSEIFQAALDAFTILKNFDKLLAQTTQFIKVKKGFENIQDKNRYEYVGADVKLFKTWTTKEEVSIDDQINNITGILLEYFPECLSDGTPIKGTAISKVGFYQVMSSFKNWLDTTALSNIEKTEDEAVVTLYRLYNGDLDVLRSLFLRFMNSPGTSGFSKNKANGIKNMMLESGLDQEILKMFWNLMFKTEKNIMKTTSVFNYSISNRLLQDNYKTIQLYKIQDAVATACDRFRHFEVTRWTDIQKRFNIRPVDNGHMILFEGTEFETYLEVKDNKGTSYIEATQDPKKIGSDPEYQKRYDQKVKNFIESFLDIKVPDNFREIIDQISTKSEHKSLFDIYGNTLGITMFVIEGNLDVFENENIPLQERIKWKKINRNFDALQEFLGIADGTDMTSTLRNQHGNNVAAYTLTSLAYNLPKLWLMLENKARELKETGRSNIFRGNIVYENIRKIGNPTIRGDFNIHGKRKNARDLNDAEIQHVALIADFWENYFNNDFIELQNDVFSDKNTHFSFQYHKSLALGSYTLGEAIEDIMTGKSKGKTTFEDTIFLSRQLSHQSVLNNLILDFYESGFFNEFPVEFVKQSELVKDWKDSKYNAAKVNILKTILTTVSSARIAERFKSKNIDFINELHDTVNETLFRGFDMYLLDASKNLFKQRLQREKETALELLLQSGLVISGDLDQASIASITSKIGSDWVDSVSGDLLLYKDVDGKRIINPLIEAYFYSDILLSNSVNELMFGKTFFHPNKYSAKPYDPASLDNDVDENGQFTEGYYLRSEASRKSAANKRTVIAGATVHPFFHKKYGTQAKIKMAVVKDLPATVFTMLGIQNSKLDSMDGSILVSPHQDHFENASLLDAKVGHDKKTIFGSNDAKYGMPTLLKMAAFALTNDRRRMSMCSDISAEVLYKKMHSEPIDASKLNFAKYYGDGKYPDVEAGIDNIKENKIYIDDYKTGKYWLIKNISMTVLNGVPTAHVHLIETNRNGVEIKGGQSEIKPMPIRNIYDLDQIFGGAFAMQRDEKTKRLEYSDANIKVVSNIICNEGWKSKFTGYIVNKSAIKVGARNLNNTDVLLANNDKELVTTEMDISFGGVQMDADHLLQDSDVTEMSQMISSLIQNGYFTDDVLSIYEEIGKIVTDSLEVDTKLMESGDFTKIHQKLGKELIETFAKGNEETMGLAQSYLIKAAKELAAGNENIKIPFSDPTLHGKFIATLVSNINKKGIKRKYAGVAAVLVPSRGMIQHFRINGVTYTFRDLCQYLRENGYNDDVMNYVTEPGYDAIKNTYTNPFVVKVSDKRDIDFGDTVVYRGDVIKIDNWDIYDDIRNTSAYSVEDLHVWTIRPRDLRQSDTTFTVRGVNYSIYDLNSVRAAHYLRQLTTNAKGKSLPEVKIDFTNEKQVAKWKLIESILGRNILQTDVIDADTLQKISKEISNKIKVDIYNIDKKGYVSITSIPGNAHSDLRTWMYRDNPDASKLVPFDESWTIQDRVNALIQNGHKTIKDISEFADVTILDKLAFNYYIDPTPENALQIVKDLTGLYFMRAENDAVGIVEWIQSSLNDLQIVIDDDTVREVVHDVIESQKVKYLPTSNVKTRFAEVMMGRAFAEELGLRKGDSISEIKRLKERFFIDRIKTESKFPLNDDKFSIAKTRYDVMLCGPNGEKLFVALSKNDNRQLNGLYPSQAYENRNGVIYYNDKEFCEQGNKQFYSKPTETGEHHLVLVENLSEIDDLMESGMFRIARYNYASENISEIFYQQYKDYIDENGNLSKDLYLSYKTPVMSVDGEVHEEFAFTKFNEGLPVWGILKNPNIQKRLIENEEKTHHDQVAYAATNMYAAFEKSLLCVGARIPTQSMQSFMGIEIVGFTESDVNEVYVPAIQTFLQGSDYDIDKLYIMMYDISKNGRLRTFSRLQGNHQTIDRIFELTAPTGIEFSESEDGVTGVVITHDEMQQAVNLSDVSAFNKVIKSGEQFIIFETKNNKLKREFLKMLNKHNASKLKGSAKESALKNMVVYRIQKLLKQPLSQIPSHAPITMDTFQEIASQSVLGKLETRLTSDNPFSKFTMQVQNMVGKDVIGVTAVGMKVFFATTAFINKRVQDLVGLLNLRSDPEFVETDEYINQVRQCLRDIFFKEKDLISGIPEYVTLANINLLPLIEALNESDYSLPVNTSGNLSKHFDEGINSLLNIVATASDKSKMIDAAEGISQLLSCATDNAKELILAKINATVDFADAWSYLMTSGWTVKEISELMMHPVFNIVTKYSKSDIFSTIVSSSNPEKAINFVLGDSHLSGIDVAGLKLIMGQKPDSSKPYDDNCFIHKLLYVTGEDGKIIVDSSGFPKLRSKQYLTEKQLAEAFEKGSDFRAALLSIISKAMVNSKYDPSYPLEISLILQQHLRYLWEIKKDDGSIASDFDFELEADNREDLDWESSYEDGFDDEYHEPDAYMDDDGYEKRINANDFDPDKKWHISAKRVRDLYKYLTYYVIPKNQSVAEMSSDDYGRLVYFKENILPGVKEQQINGSNLGVNQGLKTNDYEFYSKLKRTENFVNERCLPILAELQANADPEDPIQQLDRFDILRSLSDPEYRKQWEDIYEHVKSKTNVITLIHNVPNFAAMFKLNMLAHQQMLHSIWSKLNVRFEQTLMEDLPTQKLNEEEWKVMSKFSRDVLLRSWLYSRNIVFNLPMITDKNNEEVYFPYWTDDNHQSKTLVENVAVAEPITLNNDDASATFVHLFEHYIVPTLKERYPNAFTRNISTGSKFSSTYNQKIRHKRLSMNAMMADASPKNRAEYAEILKSFNEIANEVIPEIGNLTVKDLVFIYNTIVYKNAFSENGFTRIMETISLTDPTSLVSDYSDFLASLDAGEIDVKAVFKPDGSFEFGPITGNLNDLLYRLSFTANASTKFGVTHTKDDKGAINGLQYVDMYGEPREGKEDIPVANPDANDYCWEMNIDAGLTGAKATAEGLGTGLRKLFGYNSKEVIVAVTDGIIQRFNLGDSVIKITNNDIRKALAGENEELDFSVREVNRIKNAKAFVHNGRIYLNMDRITGDTLIHELMHLICASAKFHEDPAVRETYYKLLTEANEYVKANPELRTKMHRLYAGDYASDFKEECLVHLLAENFAINFKTSFGKIQFSSDINSYVQKVLSDALRITFNGDVDQNRLGNSTIGDIMLLFSSKLINRESNQISAAKTVLSQKMKTLKRILINAADNGKNSYIKYNC